MTGEEFMELYTGCPELRQYIVDQAKRHSNNSHIQEEMVQEAWMYVSVAVDSLCIEELQNIALNAIRRFHWYEKKERAITWEIVFDAAQKT